MTQRIQVNKVCHMVLDGQPQLVYPGTVLDLPTGQEVKPTDGHIILTEATSPIVNGKPTTVRNKRER